MMKSIRQVGSFRIQDHHDRIAHLRSLKIPTLHAYAADDPMIPGHIAAELSSVCPPGPRIVFPTGGHNIQKTHAAELARHLLQFAQAIQPAAVPAARL